MEILVFILVHWYLSLFFQTFYLHRYVSHEMFTMNKFWERVFYFMTWLAQGSSFLNPYAYGYMHRRHHAFTDTEDDPHSPLYSDNVFQFMWKTNDIYQAIKRREPELDNRFTRNLPEWESFQRIADSWVSRLAWVAFYTSFYAIFATHWWMWLFLPLHFVMGPTHGAIINWFAHKYGYRNFEQNNTSTNLMPWDIFMMGEGLHNNHHFHFSRAKFSYKWWEFDPSYPLIWLMNKLNIIKFSTANR